MLRSLHVVLQGTSKKCLCEGNSPVTGEFPSQKASNTEMFSFHDVIMLLVDGHIRRY